MRGIHKQIETALDKLNKLRNIQHPQIGYLYYADVKGWGGTFQPHIYAIINGQGGVCYSELNGKSRPETLMKVQGAILTMESKPDMSPPSGPYSPLPREDGEDGPLVDLGPWDDFQWTKKG